MNKSVLRVSAAAIASACLLLLAVPAQAHETRTQGNVEAVVGWANEPAFIGYPNAVQLQLSRGDNPITDLAPDELKVEVSFGDQKTSPLALEPAFGSPGEYRANLIPTRGGDYTFRFFGTINGQPYDQSYTSGEQTFDSPRNPADVSFPAKDPTAGELASRIEQLSSEGGAAGGSDSSGRAALGIAVAALALAIVALVRKGRAT